MAGIFWRENMAGNFNVGGNILAGKLLSCVCDSVHSPTAVTHWCRVPSVNADTFSKPWLALCR